ncbi:unnamed protein product [Candidula unifasciata]|uniref:Fibrinogen C-terminal domain-containing protein n=1 Tax=Candidula unifasciata TaxID=100452 RepID=A0A8S3Z105_9EUPU|nr:unnamed protein product [Candidula unifasciata]
MDLSFKLYVKNPCEHNGVWNEVRFTCKCTGGWVGDRCERYPRNCREMALYGYEDGFHERLVLHPKTSPQPFTAHCSYYRDRNEYFTYILFNTGEYDNTMTWSDYVNGFEHDDTNYWLEVFLITAVNVSGSILLPYYSFTQFRIGSEEMGYNFTAVASDRNTEGGVYGDCLTPVQGVPFSTADHDRDLNTTGNCAREDKAGWWFKTCDVGCNPLGPSSHWRMTHFNLVRSILHTYMYFRHV